MEFYENGAPNPIANAKYGPKLVLREKKRNKEEKQKKQKQEST